MAWRKLIWHEGNSQFIVKLIYRFLQVMQNFYIYLKHIILRCWTPVEVLHTVLLGVCKYVLRTFMSNRSKPENTEVLAKLSAFSYFGFSVKITGNIAYHYQSFISRDFKAWMQLALFIIDAYVTDEEKKCWISLAEVIFALWFTHFAWLKYMYCLLQVFRVVYRLPVNDDTIHTCKMACKEFVDLSAKDTSQKTTATYTYYLIYRWTCLCMHMVLLLPTTKILSTQVVLFKYLNHKWVNYY